MLQWAREKKYTLSTWAAFNAARKGHVHILDWLISEDIEINKCISTEAARKGYLDMDCREQSCRFAINYLERGTTC